MLRRTAEKGYSSLSWPPCCIAAGCSPETKYSLLDPCPISDCLASESQQVPEVSYLHVLSVTEKKGNTARGKYIPVNYLIYYW